MKASELIKELQERIDVYGDSEVVFRDCNSGEDIDIISVYYDIDVDHVIVSNLVDVFTE